ncbi:MAG: DUF6438 domain-containing protein [Bacteroidota bacterium]
MNFRFFAVLALLSLLIPSCKLLQPSPEHVNDYTLRAQYNQSVCFGRCPVYTLSLYENGLLIYQGERFTDKPGTWYRLLGRGETEQLISALDALDFKGYPSNFPSQIPDLAQRTVSYITKDGQEYRSGFKENVPDELLAVADQMKELGDANNFTKYEGPLDLFGEEPDLAPKEIIVELRPGVNPQEWIVNYAKQNVQYKERLTPNSNYHLILADPNLMDDDELIGFLREDPDVVSAQKNRQVSPR